MQDDPVAPPDCSPGQVLVAVPTLNEAAHIEACLISLIADDDFMADVHVVVADGGSRDATIVLVDGLKQRFPNLRRIDNPRRLQSAAINTVVATKAGPDHKILVRCDAHAVYPPGYVRAVAESLASRPYAASLATPMDATGATCFQKAAAWIVDTPLGSGGSAHRGGRRSGWVDHGHHAGFRLDWFRKIGGYDETFSHNEDAEYDHRLGLAGGRVWLDADIRLDYSMRATPVALWRQYWNYGRGRARTVMKHRMRPRLRQMIPVINLFGLCFGLLLSPLLPATMFWPAAYVAALLLVSLAGAAKLRSVCGLWAGPVLGIMHNAWGAGFLIQAIHSVAGGTRNRERGQA